MIRLIQFLYFSNIITSLTGAFLTLGIMRKLGITEKSWFSFFVFFAVLATYTYQRWRRYIQLIHTNSEHVAWIKSNQRVHLLIFAIGFLGCGCFIFTQFMFFLKIIPWLLIPSFISLWYVHPFFGIVFREIPYIKSFAVVFTWLILVIWVPIYLFGDSTVLTVLHLSIFHFFLLFGVLILFDIRDVEYDASKIKTLPLLVGSRWGRWLAIYCFVVGIIYSLFTHCLNYIDLIIPFTFILLALKVKSKGPVGYFALLDLLLAVQGLVYYFF